MYYMIFTIFSHINNFFLNIFALIITIVHTMYIPVKKFDFTFCVFIYFIAVVELLKVLSLLRSGGDRYVFYTKRGATCSL